MATPVFSACAPSSSGSTYVDDQLYSTTTNGESTNVGERSDGLSYEQTIANGSTSAGSITTVNTSTTFSVNPLSTSLHHEISATPNSERSNSVTKVTVEEDLASSEKSATSHNMEFSDGDSLFLFDREWMVSKKKEIEQKLISLHKQKKKRMQDEKAAALRLERTLPLDILAKDWFSENSISSELRVYLIENLLPTLVLGMEKILKDAEKMGLIDDEPSDTNSDIKFNPINLLAQYLMRNNPRYCQLHETSPYIRGLRHVAEDLKRDVYEMEVNKLAKLKSCARHKRIELEEKERQREEAVDQRYQMLRLQFAQWLLDPSGRLQLQLVQNALYSYLEISSHLAVDSDAVVHYSKELEATDETGTTLSINEYVQYVEGYVCNMSMPEFKQLLRHLDQCAHAFRKTFEHEVWKDMFVKLFSALDSEEIGYLDRHRMLHLLEKFYDKLENDIKAEVNNPRKWPVIELEELDDLYPDSEDDERDDSVIVSTEEVTSSEWESVPVSTLPGTQDGTSDPVVSTNETASDEKVETDDDVSAPKVYVEDTVESGDAAPVEQTTDLALSPVPDQHEEEPKPAVKPDSPTIEDDQASAKVSSAAGEDVPVIKEETKPVVSTPGQSEDEPCELSKQEPEESKFDKQPFTEKDNVADNAETRTDKIEEVEKPSTPKSVELEVTKSDGVAAEQTEAVEADKDVSDQIKQTDETPNPEPEKSDVVEIVEEKKEEEEKKELVEEQTEDVSTSDQAQKFLNSGANLGATLVTPAPSGDESSIDVGAVNVQFSKEVPRALVRKTTTFTTVRRKQPATDPSEEPMDPDQFLSPLAQPKAAEVDTDTEKQSKVEETEPETETVVTTVAGTSEAILVQHTEEDMHLDDYRPQPVDVKTRPASASRMSVTFAAEPLILPDRPSGEFFSLYSSRSQSRMTSVFDESQLNQGRFVSLLENFVMDDTGHILVEQLVNFIHAGYVETEEEKMSRLARARKEALSAKHRQMIDRLFNIWDNDGQGYVDNEEVEDVLSKYKGGMEASALKRGRHAIRQLRKNTPYHDRRRLNKKEFHVYINTVCSEMSGGEEVFDGVIEYLTSTIERTYSERVRGEARRKWLAQIQAAAETGGASMESVYRSVFQTLYKDADAHGNQKKVSAYVALLEHNALHPHRGPILLRYVACTPDNAPFLLGKAFYENTKGISFYAVKRGKLVHVPRVQSHGRIYFWNTEREEEHLEGSLVLVPVRDTRRRTFGLIGIDNVDNAPGAERSIFSSHEINFYQGVAKTFSWAFHHVDLRRKLLRIIDAAMSWIHSRAQKVQSIIIYFVEPDPKGQASHVLRKMMTTNNHTGVTTAHARPTRLYRKDNLFRDYLFKCVENSETTSADAYGARHTAYPLRDDDGRCQCVVDISIGSLRNLPKHENKEVQRMLKLLQAANREVMKEAVSGERTVVLEAEEHGSDETRVDIMFDRLMLTDMRENVSKLDTNVFAELKNYKDPPAMIHNILKAVLLLFNHDPEQHREFDDWITCKQMVTNRLRQQILSYDPTSDRENGETEEETDLIVQSVGGLLKGIAHGAVAKHGSRPAQQLYNWAFVCLSLIEHARKMRQNEGQPAITPMTSASTNATTVSGGDGGRTESSFDA